MKATTRMKALKSQTSTMNSRPIAMASRMNPATRNSFIRFHKPTLTVTKPNSVHKTAAGFQPCRNTSICVAHIVVTAHAITLRIRLLFFCSERISENKDPLFEMIAKYTRETITAQPRQLLKSDWTHHGPVVLW